MGLPGSTLGSCQVCWIGWTRPHDYQGIANKFYDVASILAKVFDHPFHVAIDGKRKVFNATEAFLSALFCGVCETTDISEAHHRLHGLQSRQLFLDMHHLLSCCVDFVLREQVLEHKGRNVFVQLGHKLDV